MHRSCLSLLPLLAVLSSAADKPAPRPSRPPAAPPAESLKVLKDFKAELLYSVPRDSQGSWVNMCFDNKGRIIASNQNGILYRVTVDPGKLGKGKDAYSDITLVAALWDHGPQMLEMMKQKKLAWPRFTAPQMSDLIAYLNSL